MGRIKTATLSRHSAPDFVLLGGLELMQLRKLPWLARCLFLELLALADHSTGRVETSYAVLASLLDFDAAPQAHDTAAPTQKRIRTALADLVALRLVTVDRIANEKRKGLFLRLASRTGISATANMMGRLKGRPERAKKPAKSETCAPEAPHEGQTEGQGVQEKSLPLYPQLSTSTVVAGALQKLARTRRDIVAARGEELSPQGGRNACPAGTPPGATPPGPA